MEDKAKDTLTANVAERAHHEEHFYDHSHDHDHDHEHGHGHGHVHENKKAVTNRLSRIIGHLQSVRNMVENDRDCSEVLIQLSAVDSAVRSVSRVILKEHLSTCIVEAVKEDDYESLEELNEAIDKFLK